MGGRCQEQLAIRKDERCKWGGKIPHHCKYIKGGFAMNQNTLPNQEQPLLSYEGLLDIIEAQNFLIAELQTENNRMHKEKEAFLSEPPVIENGVVVKLGRSFY